MTKPNTEQVKSDILSKIRFDQVFSSVKKIKPSGENQVVGLCPFHNDSSPSFAINTDTLQWNCFAGCGSGSAFDFIMKEKGITFSDAINHLKDVAGIKVEKNKVEVQTTNLPPISQDLVKQWQENLDDDKKKYLIGERGLSEQTIAGAQIGWCTQRKRYTIPIKDIDGNFSNIRTYNKLHALKICNFTRTAKNKKTGQRVEQRYGRPVRLYGLYALNKMKPKQVLVCEGEWDRLVLQQAGYCAVTGTHGCKTFSPQWVEHFKDMEVVFVFDCDKGGREGTEIILHKCFRNKADKLNIKIKVVNLGLSGATGKNDVTDFFNLGKTKDDLDQLIAQTKHVVFSDADQSVKDEVFVKNNGFDRGKLKVTNKYLFTSYLGKEYNLIVKNQHIYYYDNAGLYRAEGKDFITHVLFKKYLKKKFTNYKVKDLLDCLYANLWENGQEINDNIDIVNLKNGILDWNKKDGPELSPHSPEHKTTIQCPIDYNPEADCPNIKKFFKDVLPEDCLELVEEFFGYCLIPDSCFEKAFLLVGDGANGKSTFLRMLTYFIGKMNVASEALQDLAEIRFRAASLVGKLVNVHHDLSSRALRNSDMFKTLVSGNRITVEEKGEKQFQMENTARLIFSANSIPPTRDISPAYYRRWVIIRFPNSFKGSSADHKLINKLITPEEMSGLLNLAIKGLRRLYANNGFTEAATIAREIEIYKIANDSVRAFVNTCCIIDEEKSVVDSKISSTELHSAYTTWCRNGNFRPVNLTNFNDRLEKEFPVKKKRYTDNGSKVRGWLKIALTYDAKQTLKTSNWNNNRYSNPVDEEFDLSLG